MDLLATTMNASGDGEVSAIPAVVPDEVLKARFSDLWCRCQRPGSDSGPDAAWGLIDFHYDEAHRRYHDKRHLAFCLAQLDLALDQAAEPDQVQMALWFHDIINEPGRLDNEARSADLFEEQARGVMPEDFISAVKDLILVTTHNDPPEDFDQRLLCDVDLASFGCHWDRYLYDTDGIKAEFLGSAQEYSQKKQKFLEAMLNRPRIFLTDFFSDRYESQARQNIRRLLKLIEQGSH
jgi:predicted metal-dependent HD superfamily phosphohydrolase